MKTKLLQNLALLNAALLSTSHVMAAEVKSPDRQPNVLIILTDDQGYGDIGIHGNSVIETPNLNRLHNESVRLTNFHVDPTSAPTRSALMTGRYSHHVGVWHTIQGGNHLRRGETTMAEVFKHNGYQTAIFGKWHLGANYPYRPIDRGFDEWLGLGDGGAGTTDDHFWNDRVNDHYLHNGEWVYREGTTPEVLFSATMEYMKEHKDDAEPMFICLPTYTAHGPLMTPDEELYKEHPDQPKLTAEFLAIIEDLDSKVGELDDFLHREGLDENTIVIFMTDNGGTYGCKVFNGGMTGQKGSVLDGGHRVPCFIRHPNGSFGEPRDISTLTAHIDLLPTFVDMLSLDMPREVEFDGESLKPLLEGDSSDWEDRTLFVETQRKVERTPETSAIMTQQWRLVNHTKLYDILVDPAQKRDVTAEHPEVVKSLLADFEQYWQRVTPDDRDAPLPIIGSEFDAEIVLSTSEYVDSQSYNHNHTSKGLRLDGKWHIEVAEAGKYEVEIRRWPREASAPFVSIPDASTKEIDAFNFNGGVEVGVYTQNASDLTPMAIDKVDLKIGEIAFKEQRVGATDESVTFTVKLPKGATTLESTFYDTEGEKLTNGYYVYMRKR
ncbi:MAG: arylsulfatase [Rikenellaceae bacterium]